MIATGSDHDHAVQIIIIDILLKLMIKTTTMFQGDNEGHSNSGNAPRYQRAQCRFNGILIVIGVIIIIIVFIRMIDIISILLLNRKADTNLQVALKDIDVQMSALSGYETYV